jgi:hypothetical protein
MVEASFADGTVDHGEEEDEAEDAGDAEEPLDGSEEHPDLSLCGDDVLNVVTFEGVNASAEREE